MSMNPAQLTTFLLQRNSHSYSDWQQLMNDKSKSTPLLIQGESVYILDLPLGLHGANIELEDPMAIAQQPPELAIPFHLHPHMKLIYVHRGQCSLSLLHQAISLQLVEGDLLLIDKEMPHRVENTSSEDIVIHLMWRQKDRSSYHRHESVSHSNTLQFLTRSLLHTIQTQGYFHIKSSTDVTIEETIVRVLCEYFDRDFGSAPLMNSYCDIGWTQLIRVHSHTLQSNSRESQHTTVLKLLRYIDEHDRECTLVDLAHQFDYHPNYVSALLKKETGFSFMDLLQTERLNKAASYLLHSDMPIPVIAEQVGYSSVSFFHKKFKERFGTTPSHYRHHTS